MDANDKAARDRADAVIERVLRRGEKAAALGDESTHAAGDFDGDQFEAEDRSALRSVAGLSTELQDISDVEYRQLRLEKVILIGLWGENTLADAENSLRELAALAETAQDAAATVIDRAEADASVDALVEQTIQEIDNAPSDEAAGAAARAAVCRLPEYRDDPAC